jgi:hypothetical protein
MTGCAQIQDLGGNVDALPPDAPADALAAEAAAGALESHPPAGFTRCGQGAFSGPDSLALCGDPGTCIRSALLQMPALGTMACDAMTQHGGAWEVWCAPGEVYFWARWDDVSLTGARNACLGDAELLMAPGIDDVGDGTQEVCGDRASGDLYDASGAPIVSLLAGPTATIVMESRESAPTHGTGKLLPVGVGTCPQSMAYVLSGVALAW